MSKIKKLLKRFIKSNGIIYKVLSKIYHFLSSQKYKIVHNKEIKAQKKIYSKRANEAIEIIKGYKDKEYIIFYNPTWLGVAASTMGLFKNIVPLEHVYIKKEIKQISKTIVENNIKSVIFSQVCDGWIELIEELKRINSDINIKVIWHGNCYEFFSDFTWNLNKSVMKLYKESKINCFGFVRSTMYEFYKNVGFKCSYLQNNVHIQNKKEITNKNKDKVKIGIYNADSRELKNIYTALSAIKLVENSVADVVPINEGAKKFAEILGLDTDSLNNYISNKELMERIRENDINIYPTFTENAPMFPLESFEMGVPCLVGNTNDYFVNTELGKYIILEKEDDAIYIRDKIMHVLENRNKIMELYIEWKKEFDKKCDKWTEIFIKM